MGISSLTKVEHYRPYYFFHEDTFVVLQPGMQ